jgi:hypothetical protein
VVDSLLISFNLKWNTFAILAECHGVLVRTEENSDCVGRSLAMDVDYEGGWFTDLLVRWDISSRMFQLKSDLTTVTAISDALDKAL